MISFGRLIAHVLVSCIILAPCAVKAQGDKQSSDAAAVSMVRDGDRWVCLGDSITAANCYPPLLARVFNHYHPDAALTVINSGAGGDTANTNPQKLIDRVLKHQPTIVSVMYGMNEAINKWDGRPENKTKVQAYYREALTYITRTLREQGITVLLMSPTLTDPSNHSYFTLDKTRLFLRECAEIVQSVATAEGAYYVPTQEAYATLEHHLPRGFALTADGVHPSALGQYQIGRSLWDFCGFDKPLSSGEDRLESIEQRVPVPVSAALTSRFVTVTATGVELDFETSVPTSVELTWSLAHRNSGPDAGQAVYANTSGRGQATLDLVAGANPWLLPLPNEALPQAPGQSACLLLTLRVDDTSQLYIMDLSRTQVLHLVDDKISGVVDADYARPGGARLADWEVRRMGDSLALNFTVFSRMVGAHNVWPFNRDGLDLMFDFRSTERFADIGIDRDVFQTFVNVQAEPFFGVGLRAWTGWGMDFASYVAGEQTDTGYRVRLLIQDNFDLRTPVKLSKRDYVGLLVNVSEQVEQAGKLRRRSAVSQTNDTPVSLYANNLMIIDLRGKIAGDQIINAHLTPLQAPAR